MSFLAVTIVLLTYLVTRQTLTENGPKHELFSHEPERVLWQTILHTVSQCSLYSRRKVNQRWVADNVPYRVPRPISVVTRSILDRHVTDMPLGYRRRVDRQPTDIDHRTSINENPPIHYRYFTDNWSTVCRHSTRRPTLDTSTYTHRYVGHYSADTRPICRSPIVR